jgi:hypothetical protein
MKYYVYEHYKPKSNIPFYVGKGSRYRAYQSGDNRGNIHWQNIVKKHGFKVRFVAIDLSEIEALWLENMCIVGWGRVDLGEGPLTNHTDGGDGASGYKYTKNEKKILKKRMLLWWKEQKKTDINFRSGKNNKQFGKCGKKCLITGTKRTKEFIESRSKPVETPIGVFASVTSAAKTYGCSPGTMRYRCKHKLGYRYVTKKYFAIHKKDGLSGKPYNSDPRVGRKKHKDSIKHQYKKIKTPLGTFDSITEAAKKHDCTLSTIKNRTRTLPELYVMLERGAK